MSEVDVSFKYGGTMWRIFSEGNGIRLHMVEKKEIKTGKNKPPKYELHGISYLKTTSVEIALEYIANISACDVSKVYSPYEKAKEEQDADKKKL